MTAKSHIPAKTLVAGKDVDYCGFLYQCLSPSKSWTKRFVVLLSKNIYVYSKKSSKNAKVICPLHIFNLNIEDHENKSKFWIFHLGPKPEYVGVSPLVFGADSSSEMEAFVIIFNRIVGMPNMHLSNNNTSFNENCSQNFSFFDQMKSLSVPDTVNEYEMLSPTVTNNENTNNLMEEYNDGTSNHDAQSISSNSHYRRPSITLIRGPYIQKYISEEYNTHSAPKFRSDSQSNMSEENDRSCLNSKGNSTLQTSNSNSKIELDNEEPGSDDCIYYDEPSANLENILFYGKSEDAYKEFIKNFQIGSYLIRQNDDRQVLTVQCEKQVVKYILDTDTLTNKVHIRHQKRTFDNLLELVTYYRENDIPHQNIKLTIPYKLVDKTL